MSILSILNFYKALKAALTRKGAILGNLKCQLLNVFQEFWNLMERQVRVRLPISNANHGFNHWFNSWSASLHLKCCFLNLNFSTSNRWKPTYVLTLSIVNYCQKLPLIFCSCSFPLMVFLMCWVICDSSLRVFISWNVILAVSQIFV